MNKGYRLIGISIVASTLFTTMLADAHVSSSKASMFKEAEATLQSEASDRPVIAPLDRAAPASDPIQKATTKQQKQARFNAEEGAFQEASRNVPAYHPVDKTAQAADPANAPPMMSQVNGYVRFSSRMNRTARLRC